MSSGEGLERLAKSFGRHLRAKNKSEKTVETYGEAVEQLADFLEGEGLAEVQLMTREHIEGFLVQLLSHRSAATAHCRYRALRQFTKWLAAEGLIANDPMVGMKPPIVPE